MNNLLDNVLKNLENNQDSYIILRINRPNPTKNDIPLADIIKIFNWGQLNTVGRLGNIYKDFLKYTQIIDCIVDTANTNKNSYIKDYKLNDNYINTLANISFLLIYKENTIQIMISTSRSEKIEFAGKYILPAELLEMRNNFTASVGHELRTPLTSIMSIVELMEKTNTNAKQTEYINFLKGSSTQLLSIINDIMDYSKLEDNRLRLESSAINLRKCIETSFSIVAADFTNVHIDYITQIDNSCPVEVFGDEVKINQILINLIKNAVKFSPDGSKITVHLYMRNDSGHKETVRNKFIFEVIDQGIGISPADIEKLFVPYSQLNQEFARKKHGGTGLGLMISKKLCTLMGGNISVESEPGKGSTFRFSLLLPINESPTVNQPFNTEFSALIKGKNILVVDDREEYRISIGQIILSWGATYSMCATPNEALAMLNSTKFHLAILDYSMPPYMNGRELALEIKRRGKTFPIIILSSLNENIDGPFTLLFKPVQKTRLEEAIKSIFTPIISSMSPSFTPGSEIIRSITPALPATPTERTNNRPTSRNKSERILVVDDYEPIRFGIIESLHYIGYSNVDSAENGKEAVKMVEQSVRAGDAYKYIFMDIVMPVMDGINAVRAINILYPAGRPKIIALTANVSPEDEKKYLLAEYGRFDKYMSKPTSIDKIKKVIQDFDERFERF